MKAKKVIALCNGRKKIAKGRLGGDHKSYSKDPQTRHEVLAAILDREAREVLVEGYHPAATVDTDLDPTDLRHTVVSCGRPEDDDTDGTNHWYIPIDVPSSNGSCSLRKVVSKPPIRRDFRPKLRQLLPIDHAIRRA